MKKYIFATVIYVIIATTSFSQNFIGLYSDFSETNAWSNRFYCIETDNFGNTINSLSYWMYSFVLNGEVYPLNENSASMLLKRDENGNIVWAKKVGGGYTTEIYDMYVDNSNNIYLIGATGDYEATTTFVCGDFEVQHEPGSYTFIVKLDPAGEVIFGKTIKIRENQDIAHEVCFRILGNGSDKIVVSFPTREMGEFSIDEYQFTIDNFGLVYAGMNDVGEWIFAKAITFEPNNYFGDIKIALRNDSEIYIAGNYSGLPFLPSFGTVDDGWIGESNLLAMSDFAGNFQWALSIPSTSSSYHQNVLESNNRIYYTNSFNGSIDLGTFHLESDQLVTFLSEIDNQGNFLWANKYGDLYSDIQYSISTDEFIYLTGLTDTAATSNTFNGYILDYSATSSNTDFDYYFYLLKVDLDGNVASGATYTAGYSYNTIYDMAHANNKLYLTGTSDQGVAFGNFVMTPAYEQGNYVAIYSDNSNLITGASFYDFNSNNVFDDGDENFSSTYLLSNGSLDMHTLLNGTFNLGADQSTYSLSLATPPLYYEYNTINHTAEFTELNGQIDSGNDFIFQPIPNQNDIMVDIVTNFNRPGFDGYAFVTVKNIGTTQKSGILNVSIDHPEIEIVSGIPEPINFDSNNASFDYNLQINEQEIFKIKYYISPDAENGSEVNTSANAPDPTDVRPEDNTDIYIAPITGSYDPNSKEVNPRTSISPEFVANENSLEYIVHFQNTGNDTAFTVIVIDTLFANLNLSSFRLISSSHETTVNLYDNVVWFRFNQINLVDSITNEPLSHGFVKYSIAPLSTLQIGDFIENTAYIYFDYNQPVETNTTHTQIAIPSSSNSKLKQNDINIFPNPTSEKIVTIESANEITEIRVNTILGEEINIDAEITDNSAKLNTSKLRNGIYMITIKTQFDTICSKLIIKDRE